MYDNETIRATLKQMRALTHDGRERISILRPAWGAHLADETMRRLSEAIDVLEAALGRDAEPDRKKAASGGTNSGPAEPERYR